MDRKGDIAMMLFIPIAIALVGIALYSFITFKGGYEHLSEEFSDIAQKINFNQAYCKEKLALIAEESLDDCIGCTPQALKEKIKQKAASELFVYQDVGNFYGKIRSDDFTLTNENNEYNITIQNIHIEAASGANSMKRDFDVKISLPGTPIPPLIQRTKPYYQGLTNEFEPTVKISILNPITGSSNLINLLIIKKTNTICFSYLPLEDKCSKEIGSINQNNNLEMSHAELDYDVVVPHINILNGISYQDLLDGNINAPDPLPIGYFLATENVVQEADGKYTLVYPVFIMGTPQIKTSIKITKDIIYVESPSNQDIRVGSVINNTITLDSPLPNTDEQSKTYLNQLNQKSFTDLKAGKTNIYP